MLNKKPAIVAIDDEAIILNSLVAILQDEYSVRAFSSGKTALKYIEKHPCDLVIADFQMPEMSGCDVLNALLSDERWRDIPVIFLTGEDCTDLEVWVLEQGAADYITKPIASKLLKTRINMQIELRMYRKQMESMVTEKAEDLRTAYQRIIARNNMMFDLLACVTDMRDHETGGHIMRTTEFVRIIIDDLLKNPMEGYTLSETLAEDIIKSVKLHDLGKIAIPDKILLKPSKLTEEEFEIIKSHPAHGAHLLDEVMNKSEDKTFLSIARDVTLYHHERWNGTGYPKGLKGSEIPLAARIVALADAYDAITAQRHYKPSYSHSEAVKKITQERGEQFDPNLTGVFLKHEKEFEAIVEHSVRTILE